jgi:hypothetical protein
LLIPSLSTRVRAVRVAEGSGLVPGNAKLANEAEGGESEDFFDAVDCCN